MKKVTERMCAMCKVRKPKSELLRIAKNKCDEISIDFTNKAPGRGAYICKNENCIKNAEKRSVFEKSFKCKIDRSIYSQIYNLIEIQS